MSKKNVLHSGVDNLVPSVDDTFALGLAVEMRFTELCGAYLRIKGVKLKLPPHLKAAALKWREMVLRHRRGDRRNTRSELVATIEIANWTLKTNCFLRNQDYSPITWRD